MNGHPAPGLKPLLGWQAFTGLKARAPLRSLLPVSSPVGVRFKRVGAQFQKARLSLKAVLAPESVLPRLKEPYGADGLMCNGSEGRSSAWVKERLDE
jgi:hypothetical protein